MRLTKEDVASDRLDSAERRMEKEDGGLARHSTECNEEINWKEAMIVNSEKKMRQSKALEGIASPREQHRGNRVLNYFEQLEYRFFDSEKSRNDIKTVDP